MKLVGKKLYRTGPLKCWKISPGFLNLVMYKGKLMSKQDADAAREKDRQEAQEKKEMRETFLTKQEGRGPQQEMRDIQTGAIKDIQSGAAARRGAEAGLRAQIAGAGARPGSAAGKRALGRAAEAGVMSAGARAADSAAQAARMAGGIRGADIGLARGDQRAAASYYTKMMGQRLAREGMKAQIEAARAGAQQSGGGGKAAGGAIYKKYAKGGEYPRRQGKIEGPGTEESDSIKAKLSDGEFVVNSATVRGLGKAMGAKGKKESREKGSSFLYRLQAKYGKKEDMGRNLALGGMEAGGAMFTGAELGKLASDVAATGALGKNLKGIGSAASAGFKASEDIMAKEKAAAKEAKAKERAEDDDFIREQKMEELMKKEGGPEAKGLRETKSIMKKAGGGVIHTPVKAQPEDVLKKRKAKGGEVNPRIPRKKGQPAKSKKHSDLYTDEDPKGTIHGLGFKDVAKAKSSVSKISKSSRSHAHKVQAAVAMEQRAKEMGKNPEAAVYRKFINKMKEKTKKISKAEGGEVEYKKGGELNKKEEVKKQIVKELNKASKMHKSQAERLNKLSLKYGGKVEYNKGGGVKPDFLDVDKDGDKKESMKKAFKEKNMKHGGKVHYNKGGKVKLGKGVQAKKKFNEAIGYKGNKVFDKKAEKDYKEGDTGYKNYEGEKSIAPREMFLGGLMKSPLGKALVVGGLAAATGGIGAAAAGKAITGKALAGSALKAGALAGAQGVAQQQQQKEQIAEQNRQMVSQAGQQAGAGMAGKGMGMVKDESMSGGFEKGGKVKKDHPHYKYLKDLDEFMARQFPKGKKVEVDAEKKSFKAIGAKKGSIEPVKLKKGVSIDLSNKALDKKLLKDMEKLDKEQQAAYKAFLKKGMPDSIKKLGLADSEARKEWQKMALKKAQSLKETGGDAKDLERVGKKQVLDTLRKREELASRERGKQKFLKKQRKINEALIKDTGDGSAAENVFKREKRKFIKGIEDAEKKLIKDTGDASYAEDVEKALLEKERKGKKELKKMFKQEASKKIHSDKLVPTGKGKNVGVRKQTVEEADFERSVKDPKARKFLIEQGKLDFKDMTPKEKFAQRAKERAERDDKEAKEYEKKTGFFGRLGDRFKTGELFGSSKDILAAKRKMRDREQAKREKSGEDFEAKKALQDQKIKDRKRLIEADSPDKVGVLQRLKKPKPVVAPEAKQNVKQIKDVKDSVESKTKGMSTKDKVNIGLAIGKAALQARAASLAAKERREAENRRMMTQARMAAAGQLGATGRQLMAGGAGFEMGGSVKPGKKEVLKEASKPGFKKGGKLSFKEILKKRKMRY